MTAQAAGNGLTGPQCETVAVAIGIVACRLQLSHQVRALRGMPGDSPARLWRQEFQLPRFGLETGRLAGQPTHRQTCFKFYARPIAVQYGGLPVRQRDPEALPDSQQNRNAAQ